MLKKIIILIPILLVGLLVVAQEQLNIKGTVNIKSPSKVYLYKWSEVRPTKIDSTMSENGDFGFKRKDDLPGVFFLTFERFRMPVVLFPENSPLFVNVQLDADKQIVVSSNVTGSSLQSAFAAYMLQRKTLSAEYYSLVDAYGTAKENNNQTEMERINKDMQIKENQMNELELKMIASNTGNILSVFFLVNNRDKFDYSGLKTKIDQIPSALQKNDLYSFLQKHLLKIKK